MNVRSLLEILRNQLLVHSEINDFDLKIEEHMFNQKGDLVIECEENGIRRKFHVELKQVLSEAIA